MPTASEELEDMAKTSVLNNAARNMPCRVVDSDFPRTSPGRKYESNVEVSLLNIQSKCVPKSKLVQSLVY